MSKEKNVAPFINEFKTEPKNRFESFMIDDLEPRIENRKTLLLHSCCGPCSTAVVERLAERYKITLFFYNPNITDSEEYKKRRRTQKEFVAAYNEKNQETSIAFMEGNYDVDSFYQTSKGLENELEGGKRCTACFKLRIEQAAQVASLNGFEVFGTTLTVSPHKNCEIINKIGLELAVKYKILFIDEDFKKQAGYQRSIELSKKYDLYRQNHCGCQFSK